MQVHLLSLNSLIINNKTFFSLLLFISFHTISKNLIDLLLIFLFKRIKVKGLRTYHSQYFFLCVSKYKARGFFIYLLFHYHHYVGSNIVYTHILTKAFQQYKVCCSNFLSFHVHLLPNVIYMKYVMKSIYKQSNFCTYTLHTYVYVIR